MLHRNPRASEKNLKDKRLSLEERNILKGWLLLRKNKIFEVIELVKSIHSTTNDLFESQKKLLLGICYNNLGQLKKAQLYLVDVPPVLEIYDVKCLKFIAYYNLFICYFNQNNKIDSELTLKRMEALRADHYRHELLLQQCYFMYHILNNADKEAELLLFKLDKQTDKMSESMKLGHYYDKFNFYLTKNNLIECLKCIHNMKKCRSFNLSENFLYMKILLEFLVHNKPLYAYPQQFKINHHLYYHLKIIQSLQGQDLSTANLYWKRLIQLDPENYFEGFKVKDESSLLFLAVKKYQFHLFPDQNKLFINSTDGKKEKIFAELIQNCNHPISKDVIHQLIWGSEIKNKEDMVKLKKLVSRVRKQFNLDIKFKNNCYYLIQDEMNVA
jgi:hypothetical protein